MNVGIRSVDIWDEQWKNIFDHYQQDIRHAYYIRAILNENEYNLLEIAAGSFRDVGALNNWGVSCVGVDYSEESVNKAKQYFSNCEDKIIKMDAFSLSFNNHQFDISYHNGFWTYFSDDEIIELMKEQARVTKYRIVATVHNKHNSDFVNYFDRLSQNDPLYKLRFFEMDEMYSLMKNVCEKVEIIPVGKGKKYYEDDLINIGLGTPDCLRKSFDYHKQDLVNSSERLMCIGTL